jgi:hypothetical protein
VGVVAALGRPMGASPLIFFVAVVGFGVASAWCLAGALAWLREGIVSWYDCGQCWSSARRPSRSRGR